MFVAPAIRCDALTRSYRVRRVAGPPPVVALDGVSFAVARGTVCGVLGHNGAGKTSLLEVLATLLLPHDGRAWVGGHDVVEQPSAVRAMTTYAPAGGSAFFPRLTGRQNLEFFAALRDVPRSQWRARAERAAEACAIHGALDRRVDACSDGMRQRLGVARAVMSEAPIWLLDEPTRGLDPEARALTRALLRASCRERGTTIVISTHDLSEAEAVCDQVVVLHRGRVVLDQATDALREQPGSLADAYRTATGGDMEARA